MYNIWCVYKWLRIGLKHFVYPTKMGVFSHFNEHLLRSGHDVATIIAARLVKLQGFSCQVSGVNVEGSLQGTVLFKFNLLEILLR